MFKINLDINWEGGNASAQVDSEEGEAVVTSSWQPKQSARPATAKPKRPAKPKVKAQPATGEAQ